MSNLKLEILKSIQDKSNPYCDITTLQDTYDIGDENFTSAFIQLREDGLIKSNLPNCGLKIGGDNSVSWSVSNLYVTDNVKSTLNPKISIKDSTLFIITSHPIVSTLVVTFILFCIGYLTPFLGIVLELFQTKIP